MLDLSSAKTPYTPSVGSLPGPIQGSAVAEPRFTRKIVRVPMPSLTEDRRKEMVKHIHKVGENHKTALRNVRRDIKEAVEKLEKDKKMSEDDRKRAIDELDKLTQSETRKVDDLLAVKEKELMEIR